MVGFAWARVAAGLPMAGVLAVHGDATFRQVIDDILLVARCSEEGEQRNRVEHIPLT